MVKSICFCIALIVYLVLSASTDNLFLLAFLSVVAPVVLCCSAHRKVSLVILASLIPGFLLIPLLAFFQDGAVMALRTFFKLFTLAAGPLVFFTFVDASSLARLLSLLRIPKRWIFVVETSLSFIPLVASEISRIHEALRNAHVPVDSPLGMLRYLSWFFTPALLASFQLAEDLSCALLLRGYGSTE